MLQAALADACAGRRGLVLLAGEPGIGKTRLAEETAERAGALGMLTLWGRAWEEGGAPAFWPWIQVLRAALRENDEETLRAAAGPGASRVAGLVPELRDLLPELEPAAEGEPEQARFALFDAVASLLRELSLAQPLLVVLDDLHAADHASLLLLEFLVQAMRDSRMLVLTTYQPAAAQRRGELQEVLASVGREARELNVRGFDEAELARLLEHRGAPDAPAELVRALHATTEGNPFFADEVIRLAVAEDRLEAWRTDAARSSFPLPDTVRETIRRRFAPLGPSGLEALETAAVIGREFHLGTLAHATRTDLQRLVQLLDESAAAGLVAEIPGAVGRFRFRHGLTQQTLYAGLGATRRIQLHRAVGEAIERSAGASPDRLAQLAHHFAEAAPGGYAEKALECSIRAGDHAMTVLAFEQAAYFFQLSLTTAELLEPDGERDSELMLRLGIARLHAGDPHAREALLAATDAARSAERVDLLAEAALSFRAFAAAPGQVDETHVGLLNEALERTDAGDAALRARLLARLAMALYYSAEATDRRRALADEAVELARATNDPATLAWVLNHAQFATWGPDSTERDVAWSYELLRLAEEVGDTELGLAVRNKQIDFLLELDDVAGVDVAIEGLERSAATAADPRARAYVPLQRARRALIEGCWDEMERLNGEAAAVADRLGDSLLSMLCASLTFTACWTRGRLGQVEEMVRGYADRHPALPTWRAALARVYVAVERERDAEREFERFASRDFRNIPRYNGWVITHALLVEVCAALGDAARARTLHEALSPFAARNVISPQAVYAGPVSRFLGIAAATYQDWTAAEEHFRAARTMAAGLGAHPTLELIAQDEARVPADRSAPAAAAAPPAPAGISLDARLRPEGDTWAFEYEQRVVRVRDSRGMHHLAALLTSPGVEIHAAELASGAAAPVEGDAGAVLDAAAKQAYRQRLEELREELEEADAFNDPERAARARDEMDTLAHELAGAVGLGGRDRRLGSPGERARVNVTRAIRSAVKRIGEHDPGLARELETTVRTGTFCAYEPDIRRPVRWHVEPRT